MWWHAADRKGRFSVRRCALVIGVGAAVAIMHRPTWNSFSSTLPWNLGDPALGTWILAWEWHSILDEPTRFFEGNIFHPYGEALKYSDLILPALPIFGVVQALSQSVIVAHNATIITLSVSSVAFTYCLARRLIHGSAAIIPALAFSFSGFVFMHQSHIQLLTLGFFPLGFLALFRTLENKRIRDGVWLGLVSSLLTMASFYYAAIWFVCLAVVVIVDAVRLRGPGREWWFAVGSGAAVTALLVAPIALLYGSFQARVPFNREVGGLGLNPSDLITPAPGSVLYSGLFDWAAGRQPGGLVEHGFFLGFTILTLALGGAVAWAVDSLTGRRHTAATPRAHLEIGYLVIAGAISLLLAVGPEVRGVPMPFSLLSDLPGFGSIRAVSRLAVPALLVASILGGWFLGRLLERPGPGARTLMVVLITGAVLLELAVVPSRVPVGEPSEVRDLLRRAPPGAVVELPMLPASGPPYVFVEGPRLLQSLGDWRPRFNGFSGGFPPGYGEDVAALMEFPSQVALNRIEQLDLRYVILHGASEKRGDRYSYEQIRFILNDLPPTTSVERSGDSWLIDLRPAIGGVDQ